MIHSRHDCATTPHRNCDPHVGWPLPSQCAGFPDRVASRLLTAALGLAQGRSARLAAHWKRQQLAVAGAAGDGGGLVAEQIRIGGERREGMQPAAAMHGECDIEFAGQRARSRRSSRTTASVSLLRA
jgi:hypothetical protein